MNGRNMFNIILLRKLLILSMVKALLQAQESREPEPVRLWMRLLKNTIKIKVNLIVPLPGEPALNEVKVARGGFPNRKLFIYT
jgi:hypothetical protein